MLAVAFATTAIAQTANSPFVSRPVTPFKVKVDPSQIAASPVGGKAVPEGGRLPHWNRP